MPTKYTKRTKIKPNRKFLFFNFFRVFRRQILLKSEVHSEPSRSAEGAETVFVIIVIKKIFDCAVNAQIEFIVIERERITGGQIGFAIAFEAINVSRKSRVAENGREVIARRQKINIRPKAFDSLRRN